MVDADELVVGAAGQVFAIGGEANRVNRAEVMAHMAQLSRFGVAGVARVVDSFGRPDANVAVAASRGQALAIGGDVAAVDFEILLFATMAQP